MRRTFAPLSLRATCSVRDFKCAGWVHAWQEYAISLERLAQVLDLDADQLALELSLHEPIARHEARTPNTSSFECWRTAVMRTSSAAPAVRAKFPSENLFILLSRYGAWSGASTSGIEQLFSRLADHIPPDRQHMSSELYLAEAKLLADVTLEDSGDVLQIARKLWTLRSGPPRASCATRLDKGIPRPLAGDSEASFARKRRRLIDESADIVSVQHALQEVQEMTEACLCVLSLGFFFVINYDRVNSL